MSAVLAAALATVALSTGYVAADDETRSYIVVFRAGVTPGAKTDDVERRFGFASDFRYASALKGFAARLNAVQLARLRADPDVAFVSSDRVLKAIGNVPIRSGDSAPPGIRRIGAATTTTAREASTVNVAVVDTGVDLTHPDLNAVNGKNCIGSGTARDDNGHGTHVAGTIGARNNGAGVVGVAPGTKIYAVKVLNAQGSGTDAQVICGIDWVTANAAALNIKVANMSLGGPGADDGNCGNTNGDALHRAVCNSVAAGVTWVVAAGNSGEDFAGSVPANYNEALTVTAMADFNGLPGGGGSAGCIDGFFEQDDAAASFSNFTMAGSSDVPHTIAAPGVCIQSTWPGGRYQTISGTSMASPHMAGVVALCFGERGATGPCTGLKPAEVITKMRAQAAKHSVADPTYGFQGDPSNPAANLYYGYLATVDFVPDTTPPVITAVSAGSITPSAATITWTTDELSDSRVDYGTTASYGQSAADATLTKSHSFRLTGLSASMTYHFRVRSADVSGNSAMSSDQTFATLPPSADLILTAAPLASATADVGSNVRYTLSVTSGGESPATSVSLVDTLPSNMSFVAAAASQGSCAPSGSTVTCSIGGIVANPVVVDRPVAYWRLSDPAGTTTAADFKTIANGTYQGQVALESAGAVPGDPAAGFSGGSSVAVPAVTGLDLTSAVTVEAWVKPTAAGSNGGVFEKTVSGTVNTAYLLFLEGGQIKWRGKPAGGGCCVTAVGPSLAAGTWSHVVGTFDGTALRLYVNGALAATANTSALAGGAGVSTIGVLGREGGSSNIYPFNGAIDEVAIYSSALPAGRVLAHYTNAATTVTTARVTVDARAASGGTATNTAQVSATEGDPDMTNNSVSQSLTIASPTADLVLSAAPLGATTVDLGAAVRYSMSVSNAGPASASSVTLTDNLPANASFVAAATSQGTCTSGSGTVTCAIGSLANNLTLVDRPNGYWQLGEASGASSAADASGNGNAGTYVGAITLQAPGAVPGDTAATFGGGQVSIPASTSLDLTTGLSVEAWVNPSVGGVNGGVFEKTVGGVVNTQYLLYLEGGRVYFRVKPATGCCVTIGGTTLSVGSWSHLVGTFDGGVLRLYVNGAAVASASAGTLAGGAGTSSIGMLGREGGSNGIYPFTGSIDEVAVYPQSLSAARVLAHYTDAATRVTTARVTIDVRVTAAGAATNTVTVSGAETDPNSANNSVTQTVTANAPTVDLNLTGVALPDPATVGGVLRYTISASSAGPADASGATVSLTLPANASYASSSTTQGSCTPSTGSVSCAVGGLTMNQVLRDRPVAYWRLGEPVGASVAGDQRGAASGTYQGTVTLESGGAVPADPAATFGGGTFVSIPATNALDLTTALSVEAWVRPAASGSAGGIFEKTVGGNVNTQYLLFLDRGFLYFRVKPAVGTYVTAAGPALPAGAWSHVVGTFDGSAIRLYVNGALVSSAGASTLAGGAGVSQIGLLGKEGGPTGIYPFSGSIDEVAVYSFALSDARVLAHYTDAATRVTTVRVTVDVTATAAGTANATAQISSGDTDPNTADNSVTFSTLVN